MLGDPLISRGSKSEVLLRADCLSVCNEFLFENMLGKFLEVSEPSFKKVLTKNASPYLTSIGFDTNVLSITARMRSRAKA